MSPDHFLWLSTGSTERPMILTPRLSNSGLSRAIVPSSVVQTGVKSLGWENSTAQLLPIQSWKRILPSVVSASKSGAVSLIWSAIETSLWDIRAIDLVTIMYGADGTNTSLVGPLCSDIICSAAPRSLQYCPDNRIILATRYLRLFCRLPGGKRTPVQIAHA